MGNSWPLNRRYGRSAIVCLLLMITGVVTAHPGLAQSSPGSWQMLTPMPTARWSFAAVTAPDGRIYAIGGWGANWKMLNIVEVYTPATNTWRTAAPLPTSRANFAAATGRDGRIYVMGGINAHEVTLNSVAAYNPATNTWTSVAPMPTARDELAATTGPDGRLYAIGGGTGTTALDTVEAYAPSTNTWITVAPMPTARGSLAAATGPDGRIYAIAGVYPGPQAGGTPFYNTVEAYDVATNTWSTVAPIANEWYGLAAATGPDGRIYAIGGLGSSAVQAYDPVTNRWSPVAPLPRESESLAATTGRDGRIYAMGGLSSSGVLNTVEVYTPPPSSAPTATMIPLTSPGSTATITPSPSPSPTATPAVVAVSVVATVPGVPRATTASFTVTFSSAQLGQGEVYFGAGPGCQGLVEVATQDQHPGPTQHAVAVTGNDLPGTVGNTGIQPGMTYWYETVTVTDSGTEIDNHGGQCYTVTVPSG